MNRAIELAGVAGGSEEAHARHAGVARKRIVKPHLVAPWCCLLVALAVSGCGPKTARTAKVVVQDSAGVRVVHVPPLNEMELPEWRTHRLFTTQDVGGHEVRLFRVSDGLFLPDSSLVLANAGASQVLILDAGGTSVRHIEREGKGPGEFQNPQRLMPAADGGFFVWDWGLLRLSRFNSEGRFVSARQMHAASSLESLLPLTVLPDSNIVAVLGEQRHFQTSGQYRDTVPLMVYHPADARVDTLGSWLGLERAFATIPMGRMLVPIIFARTVQYASNGSSTVIGSTDSLDLTVYSAALRPVLRVVAPPDPRRPGASVKARWQRLIMNHLPMDIAAVRTAFEKAPVRNSYPGFDGLAMDPAGRLWVGTYPDPGARTRRWIIFDPQGTPVGQVHLPLRPPSLFPGSTELLAVGRDRIAILRLNKLDVESVEVWQVSAGS